MGRRVLGGSERQPDRFTNARALSRRKYHHAKHDQPVKRTSLQDRIRIALRQVIVDEWSLFTCWTSRRPVSERTICAHLAWYLRPQLPREWDVDCEYNRNGPAAVKSDAAGNQHPADLIVHHRGFEGEGHNLLLVELKITSASANSGGSADVVRDLVRDLQYQDGVYLHLHASNVGGVTALDPHWAWFPDASAEVIMSPVYTPQTLDTILCEARRTLSRRTGLTAR